MSASRKGLKRHGMRSYIVSSPGAAYIIRRETSRRWLVRNAKFQDLSWDFFAIRFRTLGSAREWAEDKVWPFPANKRVKQSARRFKSAPQAVLAAAQAIAEEREKDAPE